MQSTEKKYETKECYRFELQCNYISDEQSTTPESLIGVSEINYSSSRRRKQVNVDDRAQWLTEGKKEIFKRFYSYFDVDKSDGDEILDTQGQLKSMKYWENWCYASSTGHLPGKTIVLPDESERTLDIDDEQTILDGNNNNDIKSSTESSCPCCRTTNVLVPRLKTIRPTDLLIRQMNNHRSMTEKKNSQNLNIVCHMYGTKTVNYNQSELDSIIYEQLNLKVSNLSDSGTDDSPRPPTTLPKNNQRDFIINISNPDLSEITDCHSH